MSSEGNRPPTGSSEFRAHFEDVVKSSKTRSEAARRLGYRDTKMVWLYMRKLGIEGPECWYRRPHLRLVAQRNIPEVIIPTLEGRCWVAALLQGEGCIQSRYVKSSDSTYLNVDASMADCGPIFRLSDYVGLKKPSKPVKNHQWKPLWHKNVAGLRALRLLEEILPFMLGQKLKEAERAIAFFGPGGDHRGYFRNCDVWPRSEFPFRTKGRSPNPKSGDGPV